MRFILLYFLVAVSLNAMGLSQELSAPSIPETVPETQKPNCFSLDSSVEYFAKYEAASYSPLKPSNPEAISGRCLKCILKWCDYECDRVGDDKCAECMERWCSWWC